VDGPSTAEPGVVEPGVAEPAAGRWRRLAPVAALLVLAPWTAECSWGGFTAVDFLAVVVFLGPLYGGAAVLVREVARRTGGGWPAIVLLAAAFGVVQAGLVDQSLFNRGYLDDTQYAEIGRASETTLVPALGLSVQQVFDFVGNHVLLSICAPIMVVEAFLAPARRRRPWLGRRGLAAVGVLYVLGSLLIFTDIHGDTGFLLSPGQAGFALAVVLALVGAAMLPRWRRAPRRRDGRVPHPVLVGVVVLVAHLSLWFVTDWDWWGIGARIVVIGAVVTMLVAWSRRPGWGQRHVVAAWSAGLVAVAAGAYTVPTYAPATPTAALVGDVAISVITLTLVLGSYRRAVTNDRPNPETPATA
jgi:hypothetical protein